MTDIIKILKRCTERAVRNVYVHFVRSSRCKKKKHKNEKDNTISEYNTIELNIFLYSD